MQRSGGACDAFFKAYIFIYSVQTLNDPLQTFLDMVKHIETFILEENM
jgi:hypothetical protein